MRAMILAAGMGSRLGALGDERPKPLLPVADVPLLRYSLALLAGHGLREAAVNLFHRGELIEEELRRESQGVSIAWSREEALLGTGGGIRKMGGWLGAGGEPFLVLNGKLVLDVDLDALVARHRSSGALATMVVREVPDAERWGAIDVAADGRVVGILGERTSTEGPFRRTMFTGVHVLSPELLARLPEGRSCIIRQGYLPALRGGATIAAFLHEGYFQEHSTPARYLEGNVAVLRGQAPLRHPPGPLVGADPSARIDPGATLVAPFRIGPRARVGAGAVVGPDTVVGRDAEVLPGARVAGSVLWPGARAEGEIRGAIVTPRGPFLVAP